MLFNSTEFIFVFLPFAFIGFYLLGRFNQKYCVHFLVLCSLIFYSVWDWRFVFLLIASIVFNRFMGLKIHETRSKSLLTVGVAANLLSIAVFKYADFFIQNFNFLSPGEIGYLHIVLPLGISFFTFQQISYLVETYRGKIDHSHKEETHPSYSLFVSFFPQLIAGPIVRYTEIVEQFRTSAFGKINWSHCLAGLLIFSIGLSKKVLLADHFATIATPVFQAYDAGETISFIETWIGILSYSAQIYFDFSGYTDMAIGLALLFGLKLPINFASPYKSRNIVEFWQTWHITLSRFLRDYLYIPLGGNRKGFSRRYMNLMIVMLLGGLWHGASWNFVIWGGLHGSYLIICHAYKSISQKFANPTFMPKSLAVLITFLAVSLAWVFFRAETYDGAINMTGCLLGQCGESINLQQTINKLYDIAMIFTIGFVAIFMMPNSNQILEKTQAQLQGKSSYKLLTFKTVSCSLIFVLSVFYILAGAYSEFIYFQF